MDYEELLLITSINTQINELIRPLSDLRQYGRSEFWVMNPRSNRGDCEDYALTKYDRIQRQLHRTRLKMYLVNIVSGEYTGQYHAVLVVDDYWCLDNLSNEVLPFKDTGYVFDRAITDLEKYRHAR